MLRKTSATLNRPSPSVKRLDKQLVKIRDSLFYKTPRHLEAVAYAIQLCRIIRLNVNKPP